MSCNACRTIPPIIPEGYSPKGHFETIAGIRTHITGTASARIGLVDLYDVFGSASQTLQGADILAARLNAVVLVPDFFEGRSSEPRMCPRRHRGEEADHIRVHHAQGEHHPQCWRSTRCCSTLQKALSLRGQLGWLGLCWGRKVAVLASGPNTPFAASGQVHPGCLDAADAATLSIPHIFLASKDEPTDTVASYTDVIASNGKGGLVETYSSMWHGWMGARANLDSKESRDEYTRGYAQPADFFEKHLH